MSLIERLTALFAPDDCLGCRREDSLLCQACRQLLPGLPGYCFACHEPIQRGVICDPCLAVFPCGSLNAVAGYEGLSKQVVASLKFYGRQSAAAVIAQCMAERQTIPQSAILTHMPATTGHIRQRGYDQAELVAKQLGRLTGCRRITLLARSGQKHQLGSSREQRLQQLTQTLRVKRPSRLVGEHIILIDDVLTTGSSVRAAATILLSAGADRVDALTFAQSYKGGFAKYQN